MLVLVLGSIKKNENMTIVDVVNNVGFQIPISMTINYKNGTEETFREKMSVWKSSKKTHIIEIQKNNIQEIILDTNTPESNYENNYNNM